MNPKTKEAYDLIHRGAITLAHVANNGIAVDTDYLDLAIREADSAIRGLEESLREDDVYKLWRREYGAKANLGSREQLSHILFNVMQIPSPGFTARSEMEDEEEGGKKRYRTDKAAFDGIDLPFVHTYEELEGTKKLRSTYLEGLKRETVNGFVHPSINLHLVKTFRSSANLINIQNQYNRNPKFSSILRKAFIPRKKGWVLVEVDEGTVEVRAGCCHHKDPSMMRYIEDTSTDMHRDTASDLFLFDQNYLKENSAWAKKTVRDWAKNRCVFPMFYGSDYFKCAPHIWQEASKDEYKLPGTNTTLRKHLKENGIKELGTLDRKVSPRRGTFLHHVKTVEDRMWNERFPVYRDWKESWYQKYRRNGYFDLLTGFRETGVYSKNDATNHPIQGIAFHWVLWAMIQIEREFKKRKMQALIVSEIHDCILIDAPLSEIQDVLTICKYYMTEALRLHWTWINVPLIVEADVSDTKENGGTWAGKKPWIEDNDIWKSKS